MRRCAIRHIRTIVCQSATYPTATFVALHPLNAPGGHRHGPVVHTTVTGVFRYPWHVPALDDAAGDALVELGDRGRWLTHLPVSEFDMTAPSVDGFVSVTNGRRWSSTFASSARNAGLPGSVPDAVKSAGGGFLLHTQRAQDSWLAQRSALSDCGRNETGFVSPPLSRNAGSRKRFIERCIETAS